MMKTNAISVEPVVGMGATLLHHSDRTACTIIEVSTSGKKIVLQEDVATRTDSNGMSECQNYAYQPDTNGTIHIATKRKDGWYRVSKSTTRIALGVREAYYDYSF